MQQKFRVEKVKQHGDWEEGADPAIAWKELVAQGYDPDAEYCVGYAEQGVAGVVFRGNLMECLTEASRDISWCSLQRVWKSQRRWRCTDEARPETSLGRWYPDGAT